MAQNFFFMREFYNKLTFFWNVVRIFKLLNGIFRLLGRYFNYFKNEDVELFGGGGGASAPPAPAVPTPMQSIDCTLPKHQT